MASYLVTGASRGLGLGLCAALAAKPAAEVSVVYAAMRTETDALKQLVAKSPGRVELVAMDVTSEPSVGRAAGEVERSLGGKGLDVVVNAAGVMTVTPDGIETMSDLDKTLNTNVTSAHLVTSAFLPLLKKGTLKKVVNLSSAHGSIAMAPDFMSSPAPAYKISKAALNMLTAQYAQSLASQGFTVIAISPGWVRTDMGGARGDLDVETSVEATLDVVSRAAASDNGKFLNIHVPGWEKAEGSNQYDGGQLPW
ncbi:Putative short chain oxidoreductase [Tolypocladium paradoxum]|uniref:Short chain oxidoreductase n=1 Tax=Tolypocladium paradoxum TaxID=94208 RepID=A0A2S4L1B4_9HYPO|nr:Putative short chain oxidoreductase [Tolypocladium paradoxum]